MCMDIINFNNNNVYFSDPIKNTIIENSKFRRIIYSTSFVSLNTIYIQFKLKDVQVVKYYNKFKCLFSNDKHYNFIQTVLFLEHNILNKMNITNKRAVYNISQHINNNFIKLFLPYDKDKLLDNFNIVLKLSGIWESDSEYGLTYKFLYI